jgi:TctA family transporter
MVLAMVLGDKAEDAFRQSMIMSKGSLSIFWTNSTLVVCIMSLAMMLFFWPVVGSIIKQLLKSARTL